MLAVPLVLALAGPVAASDDPKKPASYELSWDAPASCPSADAIAERIKVLAPDPSGGEGVMQVRASVTSTAGRFRLELETEFFDRRSNRVVEGGACSELAETVALVVAVALEPGAAPTLQRPTPTEPSTPPPPAPAERTDAKSPRVAEPLQVGGDLPPAPSTPKPATTRRWPRPTHAGVRLAPRFEFGALPRVGGGGSATAFLLWPRARAELEGVYLWPRRAEGPGDTAGVYQLGSVGARGCGRLFAGRVEFPLCLGLEVGAMRAASRGLEPARVLHFAWVAPTAGAGVAFAGERIGFFSLAELGIGAVRGRANVGGETAFESFPVSVRAIAGLEIFFAIERG